MKKSSLATVNASTGNLPRGARRPWTTVNGGLTFAVKDADGHTLFESSPAVASMSITAVNAYANLCAKAEVYEIALRALRLKLRSHPRTPAVAELLAIVDVGLAESDEFERAGPI